MHWTAPAWEEVKMDAEIGSYQEDTEPVREAPVAGESEPRAAAVSQRTRAPAGTRVGRRSCGPKMAPERKTRR
jgi:hypothetical protein